MMGALALVPLCHPTRRLVRDGLCRECSQVLPGAPDDPLPAIIAGTVQCAGPEAPPACRKCGGPWIDHRAYLACFTCGATWHRTSTRILRSPRNTVQQTREARALRPRKNW